MSYKHVPKDFKDDTSWQKAVNERWERWISGEEVMVKQPDRFNDYTIEETHEEEPIVELFG